MIAGQPTTFDRASARGASPDAGLPGSRAGASRWNEARALPRRLGRMALDIVYPPRCLACGAATQASDGVRAACWRGIAFIERPFCDRLGIPFRHDFGSALISPEAMARPPVFRRARAVAIFEDGPCRHLVHRLKYGDRLEVGRLMGRWMARAAADLVSEAPVIVAMPLHRGRLWRRQFNQAALLADEMARATGLSSDPFLLDRVKPTAPQVGMSRSQRALNVQGAFRVPADSSVAGRTVLLVDDVLTTGATANAAARALLRGGATAVDLVVFARVAGPGGMAI